VIADPREGVGTFSAVVLPSDGTKLSGRNMPLTTWKVLLRLPVNGRPMHGTVIEVREDFSTRAGVGAFTVMADENRPAPPKVAIWQLPNKA
jgi:hypothetical protein